MTCGLSLLYIYIGTKDPIDQNETESNRTRTEKFAQTSSYGLLRAGAGQKSNIFLAEAEKSILQTSTVLLLIDKSNCYWDTKYITKIIS